MAKLLPEPVRFDLHLTSQMIVIGGFGRPEHSSSFVPKLSVVAPGLRGVTLYSLSVSQISLDSCFTNLWLPCPGQRVLFHSQCFLKKNLIYYCCNQVGKTLNTVIKVSHMGDMF